MKMKICRHHKLTQRLADGELPQRRKARLEAHLEKCPSCRALLEEIYALKAELVRATAPAPAPGFEHRILAAANAHPHTPAITYKWREINLLSRRLLPAAAAICLLLGSLTLFQLLGTPLDDNMQNAAVTIDSSAGDEYFTGYKLTEPETTFISGDEDKSLEMYYDTIGGM